MDRLQLLRQPLLLLLGRRLHLIATPAGLPITWALADPKIDERQVLMTLLDHDRTPHPAEHLLEPVRKLVESIATRSTGHALVDRQRPLIEP